MALRTGHLFDIMMGTSILCLILGFAGSVGVFFYLGRQETMAFRAYMQERGYVMVTINETVFMVKNTEVPQLNDLINAYRKLPE